MKKFTFLIANLISISTATNAQIDDGKQKRLQQIQEKFYRYIRQTKYLASFSILSDKSPEITLKNRVATPKLDSIITMILGQDEETWQNDMKEIFIYDQELKNTEYIEKEWDAAAQTWSTYSRIEIEYDDKKINYLVFYSRDEETEELLPKNKIEAFYNAEGKLDSVLQYISGNNDTWDLAGKQNLSYNQSGKLTQIDILMIGEDEDVNMRIIYSYNSSGYLETTSTSLIREQELLISETYYIYDGTGKRTSDETWNINYTTFTLEKSSRTDYEYNDSGILRATYSNWNSTTETWEEEQKDEYTYSDTDFSNIAFPGLFQFYSYMYTEEDDLVFKSFHKAITQIDGFEMVNSNWKNTERTSFYYSEDVSSNTDIYKNNSVVMYPNPSSEWITFRWNKNYEQLLLEIYKVTGAKIMERPVFSDSPVPVHQLDNGIYLFKLLNEKNTVHSGKLIIK
jgi:hypothetical protein